MSVYNPVFKLNVPDDGNKVQHLPKAPGKWPFRLNLDQIPTSGNLSSNRLVFNMVGDTGSVRTLDRQERVVRELAKQYQREKGRHQQPQFLYHLGDVVYNFGEASEYYRQFFRPYEEYPAPIFAIAGNHDGDVNPAADVPYESLDSFLKVFCDTRARITPLSENARRSTMIQPNVYWTLQTPVANIIGLYSNVPKFGVIKDKQKEWLVGELKAAFEEQDSKLIILCVHHAPYSADINHGSSKAMITVLEEAFQLANVRPDIVFSGHVHNYQRFVKTYPDGFQLPFIVAGAGGYAELHPLAEPENPGFDSKDDLLNNVRLQRSCTDRYGFLKLSIYRKQEQLVLDGVYYTINKDIVDRENEDPPTIFDQFTLTFNKQRHRKDWKNLVVDGL